MAEYIEREAALQKVKKLQETDPAVIGKKQFADGYFTGLDELEVILRGVPAAEAVPIVRCKDCKNYSLFTVTGLSNGHCSLHHTDINADEFCSYGERR